MNLKQRFLYSDFHRVFNLKTDEGKGTSMLLLNTVLANIANAVVSGALQTAFLVANGIDIVRVGVISFIPYLSWALSVFSPMIMAKFKKRRAILLFNHTFYYFCVVLATTIMPLLVEGVAAKTACFALFMFLGSAVDALIGSGATAWHLHFIPEGRERNVYVSYSNTCSIVLSTVTAIVVAVFAGALSGSDDQIWILLSLRVTSFVLFALGGALLYLIPKEYPYEQAGQRVRLRDAFTQPLRCKPFLMTTLFCIFWSIGCNLNASTWNVYLLDTLKYPLWYTYWSSGVCALGCLFLSSVYRRFVDKMSVFRALQILLCVLLALEFASTYITKKTVPLFFVIGTISGLTSVGYNMAYNNLFYINLPGDANNDLFAVFWNMTINVAAFAGSAVGTAILSLFERHGVYHILGMEFHGSQLLTTIKGLWYAMMVLFVARNFSILQPKRLY